MRWIILAYKNLWRKKVRSVLTVLGVSIAVAVLVRLMGFDAGYKRGLESDIDRMGYQVLVTAKGCPYEAATLMLKGGGGLRYMEDAILQKIQSDARVDKITPQLVHTVFDPDKNNGRGGLSLFLGIHKSLLGLKPWMTFQSGSWFSSPDADEVIVGFEAAELEQRSIGDKIFVPDINKVLIVKGVFDRTGTQDDGIMFVPLKTAQRLFELEDKLTGIGIKLKEISQIVDFEEDLYNEPFCPAHPLMINPTSKTIIPAYFVFMFHLVFLKYSSYLLSSINSSSRIKLFRNPLSVALKSSELFCEGSCICAKSLSSPL